LLAWIRYSVFELGADRRAQDELLCAEGIEFFEEGADWEAAPEGVCAPRGRVVDRAWRRRWRLVPKEKLTAAGFLTSQIETNGTPELADRGARHPRHHCPRVRSRTANAGFRITYAPS